MNGYRGFWEVVEAAGVAAMCGRRESTTIDDIRDRVNIVGSVSDRGWFMASSVRRCGRRGGRRAAGGPSTATVVITALASSLIDARSVRNRFAFDSAAADRTICVLSRDHDAWPTTDRPASDSIGGDVSTNASNQISVYYRN